jgi:DNA invertase Pin-like site-specific DNA recombinase
MAANRKKPALPPLQADDEPGHMIGYARVSTVDQNPQLQVDALIRAGVHHSDIYTEQVSGAAIKRPQFDAMMKDVREGDTVVVWKLDRLARNNVALHQIAERIRSKGANLRLLDNSGLDTTTAAGRLMFGMLAVMAEFERDLSRERTIAGLARARAEGRKGGTVARHSDEAILEWAKLGTKPGSRAAKMSVPGFIKAVQRAREKLYIQGKL